MTTPPDADVPTIIVASYNEEAVIGRLLGGLLEGEGLPVNTQIIVVCNGCTDRTAEIARGFGPRVTVIETEIPSKVRALNLGDAVARGFPRLYVDADVVVSARSISLLIAALRRPRVFAAAPVPRLDLSSCSAAVRRFYAVDALMPCHRGGIGGSGVYALSEAGRARFGEFPAVTGDDAFVRRHFAVGERVVVEEAHALVTPPSRLAGLIAIKTRSHFGNLELDRRFPSLARNRGAGNRGKLLRLAANPAWWPALSTYLAVKLAARFRAAHQLRRTLLRGVANGWERDDTSRRAPAAVPA